MHSLPDSGKLYEVVEVARESSWHGYPFKKKQFYVRFPQHCLFDKDYIQCWLVTPHNEQFYVNGVKVKEVLNG